MIAAMQEELGQQDLSLEVKWGGLRSRLNDALLRGLEVPALPGMQTEKPGT
jgi:hypothetical protein